MSLDHGAKRLLTMLAASGAAAGDERSVLDRRRTLEALADIAEQLPAETVPVANLALPGATGPIAARLYTPVLMQTAGCLVYFHGGGWVAGGLRTHDGVCRRLASAAGTLVVAVDYRLAPEHPFPAAVDDALAATQAVAALAPFLGFEPTRLAVGGDSAGGGLAAVVAQSYERPPLALQLLICPILDVANESASRRAFASGYFVDAVTLRADLRDYCGATDLTDCRLSPLLARSLVGVPPALIHAAEYDPFRDEAIAYAERLIAAGADAEITCWPGMIHYFYALPRVIRQADASLAAIGAQLAARLA